MVCNAKTDRVKSVLLIPTSSKAWHSLCRLSRGVATSRCPVSCASWRTTWLAAPWRWAHTPQHLATVISSLCSACTWLPERPTNACLQCPVKLQSKHYAFRTFPDSRGQVLDGIVLHDEKRVSKICRTSYVDWATCDGGPTLPQGHSRLSHCSPHAAHELTMAINMAISILACNDIVTNWT